MAEALEISKIDGNERQVTFEFSPSTPVEAITIIGLIQSNPKKFKMNGATGLKMMDDKALATPEGRIDAVKNLIEKLSLKA